MDPCMGAPSDTSASASWHQSHIEDTETELEEGQMKMDQDIKSLKIL